MYMCTQENKWSWFHTGQPIDDALWESGEPNSSGDCGEFLSWSFKLKEINCDNKPDMRPLCQRFQKNTHVSIFVPARKYIKYVPKKRHKNILG